jgi:hypothetical protein
MKRSIVLDDEAVQALSSARHPKHRKALAQIQVVATRKSKALPIVVVVPTAVRVEAGCVRTSPETNLFNSLRIADAPLGTDEADAAARIRFETGVSVVDAHIGATVQSMAGTGPITIVSSDPDDLATVAGAVQVTLVTL